MPCQALSGGVQRFPAFLFRRTGFTLPRGDPLAGYMRFGVIMAQATRGTRMLGGPLFPSGLQA
eukprot:15430718-Alexandrium_andersonii.AAC.1